MPKFKFTHRYIDYDNDCDVKEEVEIPGKYVVCYRCRGEGVHDPAGFEQGFTLNDFAEDPDFAEDYYRGRYDVQCTECKGLRVIVEPDTNVLTEEQKKKLEDYYEWLSEEAAYQAECEAERRMGA